MFTALYMLYSVIIKPYISTNIRLYDQISSISLFIHGERIIYWGFFYLLQGKPEEWVDCSRIHLSQIFSLVPDYQQHWAFSVNNTQVIAVWAGGGIWAQSNISFFFFLFFVLASSKNVDFGFLNVCRFLKW